MGLFDKVKNMFTEEIDEEPVVEEVKVEEIKKEVTHVPIESPSVKQNAQVNSEDDSKDAKKAVFFNDRDFEDLAKPRPQNTQAVNHNDEFFSKEELAKMYGSNAVKEKKEEPKEKMFKPTPIISPVYGILDKNYHKEDIVERKDTNPIRPKTNVTIDTIRNKAYGTLEEQLKDQVLYDKNSKKDEVDLFDELERRNQPIVFEEEKEVQTKSTDPEEITMDLTKELDNLLMKKQTSINELSRESRNQNIIERSEMLDLTDEDEEGVEE